MAPPCWMLHQLNRDDFSVQRYTVKFFCLFSFTFERIGSVKRNYPFLQAFCTANNVNNKTGNIFFCLFEIHGEVDGIELMLMQNFRRFRNRSWPIRMMDTSMSCSDFHQVLLSFV